MTPPRKQPKRARLWAAKVPGYVIHLEKSKLAAKEVVDNFMYAPDTPKGTFFPVCVIPTDAASVEEMERRVMVLICPAGYCNECQLKARAVVRDLLGLKGRK